MVSTNSTELAEEAKTAFATAIDNVVRMIEQDDEMVSRLRNQSTELLAMAIEAVKPLIRYVDRPIVLSGYPVNRGAMICSGLQFGFDGVDAYLLRNGMFMLGTAATSKFRVLHLPELLHNNRKTEEHIDLVMTLITGLAKLFADAIAISDARRASMQDRATRLTAAAAAFKTSTTPAI